MKPCFALDFLYPHWRLRRTVAGIKTAFVNRENYFAHLFVGPIWLIRFVVRSREVSLKRYFKYGGSPYGKPTVSLGPSVFACLSVRKSNCVCVSVDLSFYHSLITVDFFD